MAEEHTTVGVMAAAATEIERSRRRLRLLWQISKAFVHTCSLLFVGIAIAALIDGAWLLFVECLQTVTLIRAAFWGLDIDRRLHAIETSGLKMELQVQAELVPYTGPPLTRDKKRPPERAN